MVALTLLYKLKINTFELMVEHSIVEIVIGFLVLILGYFLRGVISDVKNGERVTTDIRTVDIPELKARISSNEQGLNHEREMRRIQLDNIDKTLKEIKLLIKGI